MLVGSNSETASEASGPETASRDSSSAVDSSELAVTEPAPADSKDKASAPGAKAAKVADTKTDASAVAAPSGAKKSAQEPAKAVEKELPWWEACLGKLCVVDFGGIKSGLSIRRGSLVHNKKIDWNIRFKKAERLEILPTDRRVKVRLLGVGFDGKGNPAVAHVKWSDRGRKVSGVMSLMPGEKRVSLLAKTAE